MKSRKKLFFINLKKGYKITCWTNKSRFYTRRYEFVTLLQVSVYRVSIAKNGLVSRFDTGIATIRLD